MENRDFVEFLGWEGSYARFKIRRERLPNGQTLERIIVAHEGDWTQAEGMSCHPEYDAYEDVQEALGSGLTFVAKEFSEMLRRSLFTYAFEYGSEAVLAVPATGEEIYFEIYGSDRYHGLFLLVEREL